MATWDIRRGARCATDLQESVQASDIEPEIKIKENEPPRKKSRLMDESDPSGGLLSVGSLPQSSLPQLDLVPESKDKEIEAIIKIDDDKEVTKDKVEGDSIDVKDEKSVKKAEGQTDAEQRQEDEDAKNLDDIKDVKLAAEQKDDKYSQDIKWRFRANHDRYLYYVQQEDYDEQYKTEVFPIGYYRSQLEASIAVLRTRDNIWAQHVEEYEDRSDPEIEDKEWTKMDSDGSLRWIHKHRFADSFSGFTKVFVEPIEILEEGSESNSSILRSVDGKRYKYEVVEK